MGKKEGNGCGQAEWKEWEIRADINRRQKDYTDDSYKILEYIRKISGAGKELKSG